MEVENVQHPAVEKVLQQLSASYQLSAVREGIHCTEVIYCLRKAYWNKTAPLPPSPVETGYFLTGLGLQDVLLKSDSPPRQKDGIWVSADYFEDDVVLELKTTMMGQKRLDAHDFPEGWIKQLKAYCYVYDTHSAVLLVFLLLGKKMLSYVLTFTDGELWENWEWIVSRVEELEWCIQFDKVPESKGFEYECSQCRYRLRCQVEDSKED